jgi:predicted Kef-type K+ transport protein
VALLLAFSVVLLIGVLLSGLAHRSVLSTAVLFLLAGFLLGDGMIGVVQLRAEDELVTVLAELALFSVLFTDGQRVGLRDLAAAWRLAWSGIAAGDATDVSRHRRARGHTGRAAVAGGVARRRGPRAHRSGVCGRDRGP